MFPLLESILFFNIYTPTTSEEKGVTEAVEQSVADMPFLDDSDDFIKSHVDSFFYGHLEEEEERIESQFNSFLHEFQCDNKTEKIDIEGNSDYWVDGWDLGVLIVDKNGNEFYEEKHVQSELGGIWQEFTEWIVEHVWRTVEEAVERAEELGDALKDWSLKSWLIMTEEYLKNRFQ
ncbi:MAG: hypothetical protein ACLFVB_07890 [Thermoplasmata archaeon]